MKKIFISILLIGLFNVAKAQVIVNRAGPANTVQDARLAAQRNFLLPRYEDTTAANLDLGLDSCAAMFYSRSGNTIWYRQCTPKAWVKMMSSSNGGNGGCGLQAGGLVTWSGSGLTYDVTSAAYCINDNGYYFTGGQITLDAPDASLNRFDVIALDVNGGLIKITGTPNSSPQVPSVNPATQLYLTAILVSPGTGGAGSQFVIWDENTGAPEWTAGTVGTWTSTNFNSTTTPYHGGIVSEGTGADGFAATGTGFVYYSAPGEPANDYNAIKFFIKNYGGSEWLGVFQVWVRTQGVDFYSGVTLSADYGFSISNTDWQNITIPLSDIGPTIQGQNIVGLEIRYYYTKAPAAGNHPGFLVDYVTLQGGVSNPGSGGGNYVTNVHRIPGTDSVLQKINGVDYFAFRDSVNENFNPIAGTNISLTGTYPDITFNARDSAITKYDMKAYNGNRKTNWNNTSYIDDNLISHTTYSDSVFLLQKRKHSFMRIFYTKTDSTEGTNVLVVFQDYCNCLDQWDARGASNGLGTKAMSDLTDLNKLTVQAREFPTKIDTFYIWIDNNPLLVPNGDYTLDLTIDSGTIGGLPRTELGAKIILKDLYTGESHVFTNNVPGAKHTIPFTKNSDPLSYGNRWQVITIPTGPKVGINTNIPDSTLTVLGGFAYKHETMGAGKVLTSDAFGGASWQTPSGGSGSGIAKLGASNFGMILQDDSTYLADTSVLSTKHYSDSLHAANVHNTGDESISGIKTFSSGLASLGWTKLSVPVSSTKMTLGSLTGVGLSVGGASSVTYGLNVGVNTANGLTWLQSGRWASGSNAFHMTLQASGGNLGIGDVTPSEKLHVDGNIRLSGAFMPGNTAGTSGQFLTSAGTGTAPTWQTISFADSIEAAKDTVHLEWPLEMNPTEDTMRINTSSAALTSSAGVLAWDYNTNINKTASITESTTITITNDKDGSVGVLLLTNSTGSPQEINYPGGDNTTGMPAVIEDGEIFLCTYIRIGTVRYWNYTSR